MAVYKPRGADVYFYEFTIWRATYHYPPRGPAQRHMVRETHRGSTECERFAEAKQFALSERRRLLLAERKERARAERCFRREAGVIKKVLIAGFGYADRRWQARRRRKHL